MLEFEIVHHAVERCEAVDALSRLTTLGIYNTLIEDEILRLTISTVCIVHGHDEEPDKNITQYLCESCNEEASRLEPIIRILFAMQEHNRDSLMK